MEMKNASNAHIVMAFNLGDDFGNVLYTVMKVCDPKLFNKDQFLRFIKTPTTYDALSVEVVSSIGLQMGAGYPSMMGSPSNNPYAFGQFQISQGILMNKPAGMTWTDYYQSLSERIKSYGDIDNAIWFFKKEALEAYLQSVNASFHQVLIMNHDIFNPAWFEINQPINPAAQYGNAGYQTYQQPQPQPHPREANVYSGDHNNDSAWDHGNGKI